MDKMISTINLDVGYGKSSVVSDVNFDVAAGEIVAIIGANGAGKSTVLKTVVRQLKKQSGEIRICELDEDTMSEDEMSKRISMVLTERIHPELMTCFDVVATGRYPYTGRLGILTDADRKAVTEAINMVGAEAVSYKDFSKVSDGQRQRIMLARAICQDTDIMILDEPTSFLDIQFKLDILSVIKRLAKEKGKAVIMTIHELEFVPAVADKVVAVAEGKVYKIGTPEEIFTGEILEKLYGMKKGTGEKIVGGLLEYSKCLK
ncbi:MAG: ABC transporter ATP-binding protein [Pseudobutyrivibrio sp.]|nr:ABC transporter ATP-binding protein [Pseudobutyrivibrio sp.]